MLSALSSYGQLFFLAAFTGLAFWNISATVTPDPDISPAAAAKRTRVWNALRPLFAVAWILGLVTRDVALPGVPWPAIVLVTTLSVGLLATLAAPLYARRIPGLRHASRTSILRWTSFVAVTIFWVLACLREPPRFGSLWLMLWGAMVIVSGFLSGFWLVPFARRFGVGERITAICARVSAFQFAMGLVLGCCLLVLGLALT